MKVALIQPPPIGGITGRYLVHEPLNLIGLATALRDWAGAQVQIWDYQVAPFSEAGLKKRIDTFMPDIAGLTAMTSQIKAAAKLAGIIKSARPTCRIIVGGQHPTALPGKTLEQFPDFDIVVKGEGEDALACLAKGENPEEIPGLTIRTRTGSKDTGPCPRRENLDEIPIPDRNLADRTLYESGPVVLGVDRSFSRPITVNLSRGCPYRCDFCSANIVYGQKVRFRSMENIRQELTDCINQYGINHVSINDSLFTFRRDFALSVGELMSELNLTWDCRARADGIDRAFAKQLAKLGLKKVFMGTESGSQRILDLIDKGQTLEQLRTAFAYTKEAGIIRGTQFVIGAHPSQTEQELRENLTFAKKLDPEYCSFSIIMPLPGTLSFDLFKERGLFLDEDWDAFNFYGTLPAWKTDNFTPKQLVYWQKKSMLAFYLRPGYLMRRLVREYKAGRLGYQIRGAWTLARFALEKRLRLR